MSFTEACSKFLFNIYMYKRSYQSKHGINLDGILQARKKVEKEYWYGALTCDICSTLSTCGGYYVSLHDRHVWTYDKS